MILVHIIKPSGTRFQISFKDGTPEAKILSSIAKNRQLYGRTGTIMKTDPAFPDSVGEVEFDDPNAPWAVDHPETCIDIGMVGPDRKFITTKRLKGPPLKKPDPPSGGEGETPPESPKAATSTPMPILH